MTLRIDGSRAECELDALAYSRDALKKAAYRMADRCTVLFGASDDSTIRLTVLANADADANACVRAFLDEALDQDLRERIGTTTAPLRDLILAHAFSRTSLVQKP
jgi:His-Xaa-Ser system protein HxsD